MAKKFLCVIVLMIALVCTFASCNVYKDKTQNSNEAPAHTHNFGEWETTKAATCTAEGTG